MCESPISWGHVKRLVPIRLFKALGTEGWQSAHEWLAEYTARRRMRVQVQKGGLGPIRWDDGLLLQMPQNLLPGITVIHWRLNWSPLPVSGMLILKGTWWSTTLTAESTACLQCQGDAMESSPIRPQWMEKMAWIDEQKSPYYMTSFIFNYSDSKQYIFFPLVLNRSNNLQIPMAYHYSGRLRVVGSWTRSLGILTPICIERTNQTQTNHRPKGRLPHKVCRVTHKILNSEWTGKEVSYRAGASMVPKQGIGYVELIYGLIYPMSGWADVPWDFFLSGLCRHHCTGSPPISGLLLSPGSRPMAVCHVGNGWHLFSFPQNSCVSARNPGISRVISWALNDSHEGIYSLVKQETTQMRKVGLQNHVVFDMLTAEHGGSCALIGWDYVHIHFHMNAR